MALFLAGLRSVDQDLIKAAQIDGAGMVRIYRRIVLPSIGPIFVAVLVVLLQFAIKTFDLVLALTGGGPGIATTFPAIYVYDFMFQRGQIAEGAAAAMMILARARRRPRALLALARLAQPQARRRMAERSPPTIRSPTPGAWRRRAAQVGDLCLILGSSRCVSTSLPLVVVVLNSFRSCRRSPRTA